MKTLLLLAVIVFSSFWSFSSSSPAEVCFLPKESGLCRARALRYYYDRGDGKCEEFIYGGCGGNGNNYKSLLTCKISCE
uniref:Kunitz type protease inhibitor n=1 Tax=Dyscophus guineti TaxID=111069 RepID=J9UVV9_9NEOB|nr:Kunitz type protease inhibitor [Dyscophus guineti]